MRLNRYLFKQVIKTQLASLFILLFIFECQQIIRILNSVVSGDLPSNLVILLSLLKIPTILEIILPLSFFLAILLTLSRLYTTSEMTAMFSCGFGKKAVFTALSIVLFITIFFATINSFWLAPIALQKSEAVITEAKLNPVLQDVAKGKFISSLDNSSILFAENATDDKLNNIVIFQIPPSEELTPKITTAASGNMWLLADKTRVLNLKKVNQYEGSFGKTKIKRSFFDEAYAYLVHKKDDTIIENIRQLNIQQLWKQLGTHHTNMEFFWRLNLILVNLIMLIIAVPLSHVNNRQGKFAKVIPALLLYLLYFLAQNSLKKAEPVLLISNESIIILINIIFLLIGFILVLKDNVYTGYFIKKSLHKYQLK